MRQLRINGDNASDVDDNDDDDDDDADDSDAAGDIVCAVNAMCDGLAQPLVTMKTGWYVLESNAHERIKGSESGSSRREKLMFAAVIAMVEGLIAFINNEGVVRVKETWIAALRREIRQQQQKQQQQQQQQQQQRSGLASLSATLAWLLLQLENELFEQIKKNQALPQHVSWLEFWGLVYGVGWKGFGKLSLGIRVWGFVLSFGM